MMQVRCQRCGWMITLGRDAVALALAEAQQSQEQYHMIYCQRCRHAIKVQVTELRRRLPKDYPSQRSGRSPRSPKKSRPEPAISGRLSGACRGSLFGKEMRYGDSLSELWLDFSVGRRGGRRGDCRGGAKAGRPSHRALPAVPVGHSGVARGVEGGAAAAPAPVAEAPAPVEAAPVPKKPRAARKPAAKAKAAPKKKAAAKKAPAKKAKPKAKAAAKPKAKAAPKKAAKKPAAK